MAAEKGPKKFLRRLAEKLVQADVHSLSRKVINTALDKALTRLPHLYQSEVIKHKDLYADLLQGYVEELSCERCQFDLPYNLYLSNDHRKIDRLMISDFWKQKDILIKNLLQKKFLSFSGTDILQVMDVAGNKQNQGRTTLLLEDLYTLKTVSGRLTDIKSLLKLMSVFCRMVLAAKKSTDVSIRKQINLEMESLLITCKTRFAHLEDVSQEETSDYYDCLAALCCLYVESVTMIECKPSTGNKLSNFIAYILKNSLQHQLDVILQIDQQHLSNANILLPLISKTFENRCENLSCEMYLRYILAARHVCVLQKYFRARSTIKHLKKKCFHLQTPNTFYKWLTTHLPFLEEYLDKDDEMSKYLMTCPENILPSLIILLSKPFQECESENKIEVDVNGEKTSDSKTECLSKKRKSPSYEIIMISDDDNELPHKQLRCILGEQH